MAIKVLVVDDSSFFRRRVSEIINSSSALEVVATANNGQEAIDMVIKYHPDVVTMDVEMPIMDGITAVKKIMASTPVPILMFSSLTHQGASATLDALEAGARDFLPKKFEDIARDKQEATQLLQQRIEAISQKKDSSRLDKVINTSNASFHANSKESSPSIPAAKSNIKENVKARERTVRNSPVVNKRMKATGKNYNVLAIGTSTGGPIALQKVLTALPSDFKLPIVLIQHMPEAFTKAFAERLNRQCNISVKEAEDGDIMNSGCAYLAPGGKQMLISSKGRIKIHDGNEALNYKPSVDITFASLAKSYANKVLAIVLTGMGADGRDGAKLLQGVGAEIWAQDEESCVVYGMPQAVMKAGIASESLSIEQVAPRILTELKYE